MMMSMYYPPSTPLPHHLPQESVHISCQSIDLFCCKPKPSTKDEPDDDFIKPLLLIGTRNGDIIESFLDVQFAGLQKALKGEGTAMKYKSGKMARSNVNERRDELHSDVSDMEDDENPEEEYEMPTPSQIAGTGIMSEKIVGNYTLYLRSHQS